MEQIEYKTWMQNIIGSVDTLEASYKRRLADMAAEYQKDVEEMLASYKQEKKRLIQELDDIRQSLENTNQQLQDAQRLYKTESVQHKITKNCLISARYELTVLQKNKIIEDEPFTAQPLKVDPYIAEAITVDFFMVEPAKIDPLLAESETVDLFIAKPEKVDPFIEGSATVDPVIAEPVTAVNQVLLTHIASE